MQLTHEAISYGYAIFKGPVEDARKLAVITNAQHTGLYRNGLGLPEPLTRPQWRLHWTSPLMAVDEAAFVLEYVKQLPDAPPPV